MHRTVIDQAQVGFVNQGRALQSVVGALTGQTVPRDAAKFFINKGDEGLSGGCIPLAPLKE